MGEGALSMEPITILENLRNMAQEDLCLEGCWSESEANDRCLRYAEFVEMLDNLLSVGR